MGNAKWIHMMFVLGGLIACYLAIQITQWVWGFFAKPQELYVSLIGIAVAGGGTFALWRNKQMFQKASDIANELAKVTWPTRKETSAATVVVIVTTIIFSAFLGIFDLIWSWATGAIYS